MIIKLPPHPVKDDKISNKITPNKIFPSQSIQDQTQTIVFFTPLLLKKASPDNHSYISPLTKTKPVCMKQVSTKK